MGELVLAAPVAGLTTKGRIQPADVLMLRREVFHDGVATRGEAESLFALDAACQDKCDEWPVFFVEAISDYAVFSEPPAGYVSEENAAWLRRMISRDGRVDTRTELELLLTVLEKARSAPADLSAYALQQVAEAVAHGVGPLRNEISRGHVGEAEVALIRRVLYAAGGQDDIAVSRAEAETLFAINEAAAITSPAFDDLFVKAIGSFLLAAVGHPAPSRREALDDEAFLADAEPNLGRFFSRMLSGGVSAILKASTEDHSVESHFKALNARHAAAETDAARLDQQEVEWLARRIGRSGRLNRNERALVSFLSANASSIHPDLEPILRMAG